MATPHHVWDHPLFSCRALPPQRLAGRPGAVMAPVEANALGSGITAAAAASAAAALLAAAAANLHTATFPLQLPAGIHETAFGEFVPLSDKAGVPVLVRLRERQWGALARLPAAKLTEAGYRGEAERW